MLAGPPYPLAEALRIAGRVAGTPGPVVVPASAVKAAAAITSRLERVLPLRGIYSAEALRASLATYLGNPAKAQQQLGWSARSLEEGLTAMARTG
jgi:hypothetical protein